MLEWGNGKRIACSVRMMEGHAPSWPLMLDTTDATEHVPPEILIAGVGRDKTCHSEGAERPKNLEGGGEEWRIYNLGNGGMNVEHRTFNAQRRTEGGECEEAK